jgi:hypothetical protein
MLGAQLGDEHVDRVLVPLAGVLGDDVALRVDEHQRGPGASGVGLPGLEVGVVEHRVRDLVALRGRPQRVRVGLVHELRRVDAHDDELTVVLLLQRPKLVEDMQAVDAAERPEVEQDEAAAQVGQAQGALGVQPPSSVELGRSDAGAAAVVTHCAHAKSQRHKAPRASRVSRGDFVRSPTLREHDF